MSGTPSDASPRILLAFHEENACQASYHVASLGDGIFLRIAALAGG